MNRVFSLMLQDCRGKSEGDSCCSPTEPCGLWGGDCNSDSDCAGGLVCGSNNCNLMFPSASSTSDCCVAFCEGLSSQGSCCSDEKPCDKNYGDCDGDSQCAGSLECGSGKRTINLPLKNKIPPNKNDFCRD